MTSSRGGALVSAAVVSTAARRRGRGVVSPTTPATRADGAVAVLFNTAAAAPVCTEEACVLGLPGAQRH